MRGFELRSLPRRRYSVLALVLVAVVTCAATAGADIPSCNQVQNAPTIATCSCICEKDSMFSGCQDQTAGTATPTPSQCPDMLQGRRVLSGGDALLATNPTPQNTDTRVATLLFAGENDTDDPGLGVIDGDPSVSTYFAACKADPFPMQTRFARLFDLPYDLDVTLWPTGGGQADSICNPTSSSAKNLTIDIRSVGAAAGPL